MDWTELSMLFNPFSCNQHCISFSFCETCTKTKFESQPDMDGLDFCEPNSGKKLPNRTIKASGLPLPDEWIGEQACPLRRNSSD